MFKRNQVELVGNLVGDPEFRDLGEFQYANFFLAVDRIAEINDGNTADFVPIVCKNDLAISADTYLRKGRRIFVEGRIQVRNYSDDSGARRYVTEIVAKSIQYLDAPPEDVSGGNQGDRNNNRTNNDNNRSDQGQGNNGGDNRGGRGNDNGNRGNGNHYGNGNRNGNRNNNGRYGRSGSRSGSNNNRSYGNSSGSQGRSNQSYSGSGAGGKGSSQGGDRMPWE